MGVIAHAIGRIVLAEFFFLTIATPPAYASTDSTEITDQWWNPAESGWGVRDQRALVRWPIPPRECDRAPSRNSDLALASGNLNQATFAGGAVLTKHSSG